MPAGEQGPCKTEGCRNLRMWKQAHGYCGSCRLATRTPRDAPAAPPFSPKQVGEIVKEQTTQARKRETEGATP